MTPLNKLANQLRAAFPSARIDVSEPAVPGGVGFLDVSHRDQTLEVLWNGSAFGVSSPEGHAFGEKSDEVYPTVEEVEARIKLLLQSGARTEPIQLRDLRAERKMLQVRLASLLGITQPAISQMERRSDRMSISTLKQVVEAMGGTLMIQVSFPDGAVRQIAFDGEKSAALEVEAVRTEKVEDEAGSVTFRRKLTAVI